MDEEELKLEFNFDSSSYARYKIPLRELENLNSEEKKIEELRKNLFVQSKSDYFVHYTIQQERNTNNYEYFYSFPFPTYGTLDKFLEEQKLNEDIKFNLQLIWIDQLVRGMEKLHSEGKYFGNLSSQSIIIDDDFNAKYAFQDKFTNYDILNKTDRPILLYYPPEFFRAFQAGAKEKYLKKYLTELDIDTKQRYDTYALGIVINGIIQEKFPSINDGKSFEQMSKDIINGEYPEKEYKGDDDFWKKFNEDVLNFFFNPEGNDPPNMKRSLQKLEDFYNNEQIDVTYNYKELPEPLVQSAQCDLLDIPELVTSKITTDDIRSSLRYYERKHFGMANFFKVSICTGRSIFNIGIRGYNFGFLIHMPNEYNDRLVFDNIVTATKEAEGNETNKILENKIVNDFFIKNIPFTNFQDFRILAHSEPNFNTKVPLNYFDINVWVVYLANYFAMLEKEQVSWKIIPENFSGKSVLVSLVNGREDRVRLQLSVFPLPLEEADEIYTPYSDAASVYKDIYSFGVMLFEILSLCPPPSTETNKKDIALPNVRRIYSMFKEKDPNFKYNFDELKSFTNFIEKCLSLGSYKDGPKNFNGIRDYIAMNPIYEGFSKTDMRNINLECNYFLDRREMKVSDFHSIASFLDKKDFILSIVSKFVIENAADMFTSNQTDSFEPGDFTLDFEQGDSTLDFKPGDFTLDFELGDFTPDFEPEDIKKNPYAFLFDFYVKKQMINTKDEVLSSCYNNFHFMSYLKRIEIRILNHNPFQIQSIRHELTEILNEAKQAFINKYKDENLKLQLKPALIDFPPLPKYDIYRHLKLIISNVHRQKPTAFLIKLAQEPEEEEEEFEDDNEVVYGNVDDIFNDIEETIVDNGIIIHDDDDENNNSNSNNCTLDDLIKFAKMNKIPYKELGKKRIKMFLNIAENIFEEAENILKRMK